MARFSAGSSLTYHLAPFVLRVITTSLPFFNSVLGPLLLFVMYTTLSVLFISSLSLDHHLYADDVCSFVRSFVCSFFAGMGPAYSGPQR